MVARPLNHAETIERDTHSVTVAIDNLIESIVRAGCGLKPPTITMQLDGPAYRVAIVMERKE